MPTQIDVETVQQPQTMALERRGEAAVGKALTLEQLRAKLDFVKNVMRDVMKEGQDYGKIPGTGEKPTLLQPGAQKLLLTFNLREQVKKETLREFPELRGVFGHREYEFTITVFPAGSKAEDGWDGVGTCSTLESKYRYRKAERKCPECGKPAIIKGKEEYGGGWVCFKKKGGCGAKFHDQHEAILRQSAEDVENEDPADCWNTVRKMAFKRALVAAAINATNTSELWTQDLDDGEPTDDSKPKPSKMPQDDSKGIKTPPTPSKPRSDPPAKAATPTNQSEQPKFPTEVSRTWLIGKLKDRRQLAQEYFRKIENPGVLMPQEALEQLPLEYLPMNRGQFELLEAKIKQFENGGPAEHAFPPHELPEEEKKKRAPKAKAETPAKAVTVPRDANPDPNSPDAPWRSFPVPFGRDAGTQLAKLDKNVLFGWWLNFEVKDTWENDKGQVIKVKPDKLAKDKKFREALDAAGLHYEFHEASTGENGPDDTPY